MESPPRSSSSRCAEPGSGSPAAAAPATPPGKGGKPGDAPSDAAHTLDQRLEEWREAAAVEARLRHEARQKGIWNQEDTTEAYVPGFYTIVH